MLPFAYYLLKVIICSGVLFAYYWLFLRNKIFHSYNRFYLLAIIVLSLTLPLVKINVWHKSSERSTGVIRVLQAVNSSDEYMDEVILYSQYNHISKEEIFSMLYISICLVFLFILVKGLLRIRHLLKNNPATSIENIFFIRTNARGTPFSFLKFIFWNDAIDIESKGGKQIFKHEIAHVQEKHSYDKLFVNSVLVLFWSNPFFWIIRKELNMIHEFVADKKAIEDGDTADFAAMILQATYPQQQFMLANNFFYSPIKRRLKMLTKQQKNKASYISRLLVLPLAVIVFAAFTFKARTSPASAFSKKITIVIDAGHGGQDAGARSADGTLEKDLNLKLAKKIKELNSNESINIILTRETDIYQTAQEKLAIAKKANADLVISIHADNSPGEERNGMSVYIPKDESPHNKLSNLLASSIINCFKNNYQLQVAPVPLERQAWILKEAICPTIIIEAGYLSNKGDIDYLKTDEAIESFAKNILNAIKNYASVNSSLLGNTKNDAEFKVDANNVTRNSTSITADHGEMNFEDKSSGKDILIILNNNKYSKADLKNKTVTFTSATFYEANDPEMIKKYGPKAADGVMIFEGANIKDLNTGIKAANTVLTGLPNNIEKDLYIDARQVPDKENMTLQSFAKFDFENTANSPLVILNGTQTTLQEIKTLSANTIEFMRLFTPQTAMSTYGADGKNGAILINTSKGVFPTNSTGKIKIDIPEIDGIKIGNISSVRPDVEEFKKQQMIVVPDGFSFASATVYFSGKGFPSVVAVQLNSDDLSPLKKYFEQCVAGSSITFDNVRVQSKSSGYMQIDGKSFSLVDKNETDTTQPGRVFTKVEIEPDFPGGKTAWQEYLRKNLDAGMPVDEGWKPGSYKIIVQFIVDKEGNISDVKTDDFPKSKTAKQCIDLIKNGPKWLPAYQNGKAVKAYKKQLITFVVSGA